MAISTKQHLSNIWSTIHGGWVKKSVGYKKEACIWKKTFIVTHFSLFLNRFTPTPQIPLTAKIH